MTRALAALMVACAICVSGMIAALVAQDVSRSAPVKATDVLDLGFKPHPGGRLPLRTILVDEAGQAVTLREYFKNSPVVLVLGYLRCTSLCGVTFRNLVEALGKLPFEAGRDYELVSLSIDPRDKPADALEARAKYAGLLNPRGNGSGVHFLTTASQAAVRDIADAIGFSYRYDALLDTYIHPAGFIVAAPDGVISRYVEGVAISPPELINAFADAEQDKSQDLLTRLLVLCHLQGEPTGRLTGPVLMVFTVANIAAGLIAIGIFATIRRRRHT